MQYIHVRQNGFTETGADSLNLTNGGMDTDSFRGFLGSRLRYDLSEATRIDRIAVEAQAAWLHEFADATTAFNGTFVGAGATPFYTTGLNAGRDWAMLGTGRSVNLTTNIQLTANYFSMTNDRQTFHVGAGGLNLNW